ncbi:MAG: phosphodiester glycosidase family protein [Leptolyngbyaceae bacterium]|nr:phosphodiester glycosidase family protein [Leptolyngbyaceae bacterium]
MQTRIMSMKAIRYIALFLILLTPLILYYDAQGRRPLPISTEQDIFQGVHYERRVTASPRPSVIHIMTVDLWMDGVTPLVTPNPIAPAIAERQRVSIPAQKTHDFLEEFGLQVAINANYFGEFREHTVWDFYPRVGDRVYVGGEAISNGDRYGTPRESRPAVCFRRTLPVERYTAYIAFDGTCPSDTEQAVSGRDVLVEQGRPRLTFPDESPEKPYPRTALGSDRTGQKIWLVVVDGKQPLYSEGLTLTELAALFQELGAERAIALDGGGSATLAVGRNSKGVVLNAPIHTKWPMRERPVANHLGFYALPILDDIRVCFKTS